MVVSVKNKKKARWIQTSHSHCATQSSSSLFYFPENIKTLATVFTPFQKGPLQKIANSTWGLIN